MSHPWGATTTRRKTLDPKLDIVFWMLLARESNRGLLLLVLNAVLQPAAPIENVTILNSDPEKATVGDKGVVLDLRVRLESGEQIDIEMQTRSHSALRERILYYWARLHAGQLRRGDDYTALRRSVVILFANFALSADQRFHSIFRAQEQHTGQCLSDQLEIHFLELPKLDSAPDRNDEPNLLLWGKFLSATNDAALEQLALEHPVLKQAKEALDQLSDDPAAWERAEQREMSLIAYHLGMGGARREGIAEGKAEGKAEALRTLLSAKFGALPESSAQRLEAASEAQLDRWLGRVLSATSLDGVLD
jgi:predicted transposase/invertase (TIGR01784 family)